MRCIEEQTHQLDRELSSLVAQRAEKEADIFMLELVQEQASASAEEGENEWARLKLLLD